MFRKLMCLFNRHVVKTIERVSDRCTKDRCVHCGKEYAYHPEFGHVKWTNEFKEFYKTFNDVLNKH